MNPRWIVAAVLAAALLFLAAGWATSAEPPKPAPTFSVAGLAIENDLLVVRFKATYPSGMVGTWDPEAIKATVARLVTVLDGKWDWTVFTPLLRGSEPPPPPPDQLIQAFTVTPDTIKRGESAKLAWACPKTKSVTLNGLAVAASGSQTVSPAATTAYALAATDGLKIETAQRILTVTDTPPPPIPDAGLRVLIIEEKTERAKLSPSQVEILASTVEGGVLDYLAKNCVKQNGVPEWRLMDKDVSFGLENELWRNARKRFAELEVPVPGWLVSNGVDGIAEALPANPAEALAILKKYTPTPKAK